MNRCFSGVFLSLALGVVCLLGPSAAHANEKVYERLLASSTKIVVKQQNNKFTEGSGVVVDAQRKWVLTNYHVVQNGSEAFVFFPAREQGKLMTDVKYYIQNSSKLRIRGQVISRDVDRDLAIIELEQLPFGVQAVPLAAFSANPGQTIHTIGGPVTEPAMWLYAYGKVRQVYHKSMPTGLKDGSFSFNLNCQIVSTTMPINPGDSGGPVVNDRGELVALNHGWLPGHNQISFLIDITEIRGVLAKAGKADMNTTTIVQTKHTTGTIQNNTTGPINNTGPIQNNTGPIQNNTGPIQNSTGPIQNSTGPIPNSTGPVQSNTGPVNQPMAGTPLQGSWKAATTVKGMPMMVTLTLKGKQLNFVAQPKGAGTPVNISVPYVFSGNQLRIYHQGAWKHFANVNWNGTNAFTFQNKMVTMQFQKVA